MKRVMKTLRLPAPLAEALRIMAFETRQGQTAIIIDALLSKLESLNDPRIASFTQEFRERVGEMNEIPGEEIPEEYR